MDGIFLILVHIGFGTGYRKSYLFEIILLPYWGEIQLAVICYYFPFLIDEIWLDRQDNILLGVILFSVPIGVFP